MHLYLGLASGVVVFVIAITGCCWVFQEEILHLTEGERTILKEDRAFISPGKAKELAQEVFPDRHIHGTVYGHETDALEVIFYQAEPEFYQSVFLNPYNGAFMGVKDHRSGFFGFVLDGHLNLWLPKAIGSQITAYATMLFVVMLVTGIILWWPKNKKTRKQRFKFDWRSTTKWRRKNFDLHSVTGFYVAVFALVLAFSGLIMAFDWIYFVTYKSWGGDKAPQFIIPDNTALTDLNESKDAIRPIDKLLPLLALKHPDYKSFEVHYPASDSSSIYVEVSYQKGVYYSSDYLFYDQNTLEEIETPGIYGEYKNATLADKVIRMNYDIHVGAIGGIFGKILAFIISLVTASLPVTGFLLWWGRRYKKRSKRDVYRPEMSPDNQKAKTVLGLSIKQFFTIIFLLVSGTSVSAADLKGSIIDEKGNGVPGATIRLLNTDYGAAADVRGNFVLVGIPEGSYTLELSAVGFETQQNQIKVNNNKLIALNFILKEEVATLSEVVIRGKSESQELSELPLQVASIDLKKLQVESAGIVSILDRSSGVRVRQSGGLGSDINVQLNGLTGRAVRQYYDGIPLELLGGSVQLNNLPVNSVDRIDIYKGVMPIDIGTDALAGGINVVPKKAFSSYLDASYEIASFNTHIATFSGVKVFDNGVHVGLSGFFNYSDNNYEMNVRNLIPEQSREEEITVERFHNAHQSSQLQVQLGLKDKNWADELTLYTGFNQRTDEIQHGIRVASIPAGEAASSNRSLFQSVRYKKSFLNDALRIDYFGNLNFTFTNIDDSTTNLYNWRGEINPNISLNGGSEILSNPSLREGENLSTTHRLTVTYPFSYHHTLKLSNFYAHQKIEGEDPIGIRITEDNIDPNTVPSLLNKNILGLSYESTWLNEKISTLVYGKFYYYDNQSIQFNQRRGLTVFESTVSGNDYGYGAGFKYNLTPDLFLRASYERAIRIPDEFEIFGNFVTIAPNFNLEPEQSNNLNIGGYYKLNFDAYRMVSIDLSWFLRDQSNLVRLQAGRNENDPSFFINEDEVDAKGVELTIKAKPHRNLLLDANLTYQDIVIAGDKNATNTNGVGNPVPNIPTFFFNFSTRYSFNTPWKSGHRITVFGYYAFVKEFSLILEGGTTNSDNAIPQQQQLDAGLTYALTNTPWSFSGQVNNLTDNEVFDNFRIPKPGRNLHFKIRYLLH